MKILIIDNAGLVYRNSRYCCVEGTGSFAAELVSLGNDVTMFGQKVALETNISFFDIEDHGIKTAGLRRKRSKILNYLCLYLYAIRYILNSDFVYVFYPNAFRYLAYVCNFLHKKYGLYIRGDESIEDKTSLDIYQLASVVLTVSPMFTEMVNRHTRREIAGTIRPMVEYDDRDIVYDRKYVKKDGAFSLLFLCRVQEKKGIIELLDALLKLKSLGINNLKLTVAGDGDYLTKAKEECTKRCLDNQVFFIGGVYDSLLKANLYKDSDLYILPTYYNEGFPRTLYEAMIFGTPIITTMVAGIPALMKDGENCKQIIPRSMDSIVDALIYAMHNYEDMGRMAKNATQLVAKVVDHNRPTHAQDLYNRIKDYGK